MPIIRWPNQKRKRKRMSGRPLKRSQIAPNCTQDEDIEFAIDLEEFTSLNEAFSRERRCVGVGIFVF